jgi:hypothetical protein
MTEYRHPSNGGFADAGPWLRRAPDGREIAHTVGLSSTASVAYRLGQLEERGEITREAGRHRSARIGH